MDGHKAYKHITTQSTIVYTVDYKDYTKKVQFVLEYQKYDDGAHFKYNCEPLTLLFTFFFQIQHFL